MKSLLSKGFKYGLVVGLLQLIIFFSVKYFAPEFSVSMIVGSLIAFPGFLAFIPSFFFCGFMRPSQGLLDCRAVPGLANIIFAVSAIILYWLLGIIIYLVVKKIRSFRYFSPKF